MPPINLYCCTYCRKRVYFRYSFTAEVVAEHFPHHPGCPRPPFEPWLEIVHRDPVPYYLIEAIEGVMEIALATPGCAPSH